MSEGFLPDDDSDILFSSTASSTESEDNSTEHNDDLNSHAGNILHNFLVKENNSRLKPELIAVAEMFQYCADLTHFRLEGPMLAAVAEVLDEMSDGKVTALTELRMLEREIILTSMVTRAHNLVIEFIEANTEGFGEGKVYIESFLDLVDFAHESAVHKYQNLCDELGRTPDAGLLEEGIYSDRNQYVKYALTYPPARGGV